MWNVGTNVYMQSFVALRCVLRKTWGIFRELITRRRTTRVAFWDPPSGFKNSAAAIMIAALGSRL